MSRKISSPGRYIQGWGEIRNLAMYGAELGRGGKVFIVADAFVLSRYREEITGGFTDAGVSYTLQAFEGECTRKNAESLAAAAADEGSAVIMGIGGGKSLDTAKAASYLASLPLMVVPTVASTDAPCSSLSVLYHEDGRLDTYLQLRSNPELVVVDSEIVAQAPARLLVAGMGDALSTFYEARACRRKDELTAGGGRSAAAYALAQACRDTLLTHGLQALRDAGNGIRSASLENIIEANIYLSGIGFESGGLAAAHAVHNGFTLLEETRPALHGEKVAFAVIVQLVLENAPEEEIQQVIGFCRSIGLPVTLEELSLSPAREERLRIAAEASCAPDSPMANMPFKVEPDHVLEAMLAADRLGRQASGTLR